MGGPLSDCTKGMLVKPLFLALTLWLFQGVEDSRLFCLFDLLFLNSVPYEIKCMKGRGCDG